LENVGDCVIAVWPAIRDRCFHGDSGC
jgi:hypothetical protein